MSTDLTPIRTALQGASEKRPITIETLRKVAEKHDIDLAELYAALDKMAAERQAVRSAGMREGKPYLAYWPAPSATTKPAVAALQPRTHLLPPKQYKNNWPKKAPAQTAPSPQPTTATKETPAVSKQPTKGLGQAIIDAATERPGIGLEDLSAIATSKLGKKITTVQIRDMVNYLAHSLKVSCQGRGKKKAVHPYSEEPPAGPSNPPQSPPVSTTRPTNASLQAIFRLDGTLTISKGDAVLELDAGESARLARFAAQINPPAECIALA